MQMRKHFDWFIPRRKEDFISYGCCGMGQAYKPSGLHCRGVNRICGREVAKYTQKPSAEQINLLKLHRSAAGPHTIKIRTNGKKV